MKHLNRAIAFGWVIVSCFSLHVHATAQQNEVAIPPFEETKIEGLTEHEWSLIETPLEKRDRALLYPIIYTISLYGTAFGALVLHNSQEDDLNWEGFSSKQFKDNLLLRSYRWDPDSAFFNYFAHPLGGSETYLRVRVRGFSILESFLFSLASSTVWELALEGWVEPISIQDMFITPIAGSMLGEARFRAKVWLKKQNHWAAETGAILLDPIQSIVEGVYWLFSCPNHYSTLESQGIRFNFIYQTERWQFRL